MLLIYCFMYLYRPLLVGGSVFVFVLVCIALCPFKFCNHLGEEERAGCFTFMFFWIQCYC